MTYRMDRSYAWNYEHGPQYAEPYPTVPETPWKSLLSWDIRSRLGVSAGLLLNSRWIDCYARLGFDLLTYKTVRSRYRPCYLKPNWVFIDVDAPLILDGADEPLYAVHQQPQPISRLTTSVCFGMPSMAPEEWRPDVEKSRNSLSPGQLLIVSVVGTPGDMPDLDVLAQDYAQCAAWAAESGAHIVEANLSCPNVCTAEGSVHLDPHTTRVITEALRAALPNTPLLIKAGHFDTDESMSRFLETVQPLVDGVELVNCIARRVHDSNGQPTFGAQRERVGILGWAIRQRSLANVTAAVRLASDLPIFAVGGVMTAEDASSYFDAGACAVMMGGAPMFNPHLAAQIKQSHPDF